MFRFFFLKNNANVDVFSNYVNDENNISIINKKLKIFKVFLFFDNNKINKNKYSNLVLSFIFLNAITFLFFLL